MMRYSTIKNSLLLAVAVLLAAACTDEQLLSDDATNGAGETAGMSLGISVVEQADRIYDYGQTRGMAAMDSDFVRANALTVYPLEGGESENLYVHRMPLPFVGIHPRTAHGSNETKDATRAPLSEIAGNGIAFHDSLTIWGYTSGRTGGDLTLFDQILVQKINGFRTACEWPYATAGTMKFYAIAPAIESIEEHINITNKASIAYGTGPAFTYTVPNSPVAQRDLLYGTSSEIAIATSGMDKAHIGEDNRIVGMTFNHILTAIRFAQGKMPTDVTIKKITLSGIKNQGSFNGTAWSDQNGTVSYTINPRFDVTEYSPTNVYIDGDSVLFLMPQTLPVGATMTVVLRKDGEASDRTLTCAINGDTWTKGYTVTYKITIGELKSDYYLVINAGDAGFVKSTPVDGEDYSSDKYTQASGSAEYGNSAAGSPTSFTVHSFRNYLDYSSASTPTNKWHNVGWKVAGYSATKGGEYTEYNSGTAPSNYISALTIGGNSIRDGGTTYTTGGSQVVNYTMATQTPVYTINHQTILTANNNVTAGFNLSTTLPNGGGTDGDKMSGYSGEFRTNAIYNSANSYIVNAKGTYKFPLVYGNSYQAGSPIDLSGNTIFVDHAGEAIKEPNIIKQVNDHAPVTTETITSGFTSDETAAGIAKKVVETQVLYGYDNTGAWVATNITTELLWQDANGLFSGVDFSPSPTTSTIGFINFTVSSTALPGNCVIALRGKRTTKTVTKLYTFTNGTDDTEGYTEFTSIISGTTYPHTEYTNPDVTDILWTWHIWCTDEVYPNAGDDVDKNYPQYNSSTSSKIVTLYNSDGTASANKILPVNLGWVPDVMTWNRYEPREVWVKLTQTGSSEVAYIKLRKEAKQDLITGTSTVYQWGRPTALPMVNTVAGADRTIYNSSSALTTSEIDAAFCCAKITSPHQFLQNPTKILRGDDSNTRWWETGTPAYWTTTKTLYDPCPPGFQMAPGAIFKVMSLTGDNIGEKENGEKINIWDVNSGQKEKGAYVYAKVHSGSIPAEDRYSAVFYFPGSGDYSGTNDSKVMRNNNANTAYGNSDMGFSWTSGIQDNQHGYAVQFVPEKQTTTSGPFYYNLGVNPCYALPVRPAAQ